MPPPPPPPLGFGLNWRGGVGPRPGSSGRGRWLLDRELIWGGPRTFRRDAVDPDKEGDGVFKFEGKLFSKTQSITVNSSDPSKTDYISIYAILKL